MPPSAPLQATTLAGTVHGADLWTVDLDAVPEEATRLLSAAERERATHSREVERRRFEAAHGALRLVLGAYRGVPPAKLELTRGVRGKPGVAGGPSFSLARSGATALVAVRAEGEIGVDLERHREIAEVAGVARRLLTADERSAWAATGADARAFLRLWTRREAALKALGLALPPADGLAAAMERSPVDVTELDLVSGHAAALAIAVVR